MVGDVSGEAAPGRSEGVWRRLRLPRVLSPPQRGLFLDLPDLGPTPKRYIAVPVDTTSTGDGGHGSSSTGGSHGGGVYLPGSSIDDLEGRLEDYKLEVETCPTTSKTVNIDDLRDLGDRCKIHLGYSTNLGGDLTFELPYGYEAKTSLSDMRADFLAEWEDSVNPTPDLWKMAHSCLRWNADTILGLFWNEGYGYYHRALLYAILTLYANADRAVEPYLFATSCGADPDGIRGHIENYDDWIRAKGNLCSHNSTMTIAVDTDGKVSPRYVKHGKEQANTPAGTINLCPNSRMQAALADYYFWWAHRLHSYALEGTGELGSVLMAWTIGTYCARFAMAEIVDVSALILHELCHITGSKYHCHRGKQRYNCCQYVLQNFFRFRVYSHYGLPHSHFMGSSEDSAIYYGDRYVLSSATTQKQLVGLEFPGEALPRYDCGGGAIDAEQDFSGGDLSLDRPVTISWKLPVHGRCTSTDATASGVLSFGYGTTAGATIPTTSRGDLGTDSGVEIPSREDKDDGRSDD